MNRESPYRKGTICPRGKKFLSAFLDLLLTFVLTMVFFAVSDVVISRLPSYVQSQEKASLYQENLYQVVESSHLGIRENGVLLSEEEVAERTLKSATLEALLLFRNPAEISEKYQDVEPLSRENDPLYGYYVTFKREEKDSFLSDETDYEEILLQTGMFEEREEGWLGLKKEWAEKINSYVVHGLLSNKEDYDEALSTYTKLISDAQQDLIENYQPYRTEIGLFDEERDKILSYRGNGLLLSFLLATLVLYLLLPLILKEGRTLSFLFLHLAQVDVSGRRYGPLNAVLFYLLSLLSSAFLPFLSCLVLFGAEGVLFLHVSLLGFVNLFLLMILSLVYLLLSSLFDLWKRKDIHQTLTQFLSLTALRDTSTWVVEDEKGK